ncbi:MAG: formate dehydrogenase subunit alpha [Acidobacteriota bacterium]
MEEKSRSEEELRIRGDESMISARINSKNISSFSGTSVLEAARAVGINIPALCSDPRLKPCGACRLCVVEIKGLPHSVASCMTELKPGMEIETHTAELQKARRMNLRMLGRKYPARSFIEFPDKPFHQLARDHGLTADDFEGEQIIDLVDDSHPYIHVDMSQCIDCYRCVRICEEVQGQFVWQIMGRGDETLILPDSGTTLNDSSCVSCGACVDTCPTGALEDKSMLALGAPTSWTKTVCPYCGTGCEMNVGIRKAKLVQIEPVLEAPVGRGHLCVKGRYAFGFVDAADRVTEPMIRRNGKWQKVSWDEAIAFTADQLAKIIEQNGKDSIGVLGSSRATNEDNYLAQKFARVVIGTNNVDCCARVCHAPSAAAMKMMLGTGAATNSFDEIELARTFLICGANPTENHPIVGERIKQAVLRNGAKLILIDPRRIELVKYADIHLQLRPGTNVLLLNAIAHTIIEEELFDRTFIENRVLEFEELRAFIGEYSPESVAERCGIDAQLIRRAARLYATEKPAMCFHGLGLTEHVQGTDGVMCLINLALLTGNIGKRGTGINPLRGQNNVQGAAVMGCDPAVLTGSVPIVDARTHFESVWNAAVPTNKGLNLIEMIDAAHDGKLKALWTIGYDVFLTNPNANETERAMRSLDLIIIQDMFMNETAREFGHVFFPATSSFEKDGTFMNAERRIQRVRKVIDPRGNSKPDWEIIRDLASKMGKGEFFAYHSAEKIWDEVRAVWKAAQGISYERIEQQGLQWPCSSEEDPGTKTLHTDEFGNNKQAALRRIKYKPTAEITTEQFPFLLSTGRSLYQFNAGTMTARTPNSELRPTDLLLMNPEDAKTLVLNDDEPVRLTSRYGEAILPLRLSTKVRESELFATFHTPEIFLNRITSANRDGYVDAPEYKIVAVRVEKA